MDDNNCSPDFLTFAPVPPGKQDICECRPHTARVRTAIGYGALPAPNVSNTTPLVGGKRKALTVAAGIPGKRRKVARRV